MGSTMIKELGSMVSKLQAERQSHLDAIAEIDAAFGDLGISGGSAVTTVRRGRPAGRKNKKTIQMAAKTKTRGVKRGKGKTGNRYAVSGTQSIIDFVSKHGAKGAPGGDIDKHWKSEGRAGSAYNIMGQLLKSKKLKKQKNKGGRGSIYTVG